MLSSYLIFVLTIGCGLGFDRYFSENGWPSSNIFETPPSTDSDKEKLIDIIQVCLLYLWFYNMLGCLLIAFFGLRNRIANTESFNSLQLSSKVVCSPQILISFINLSFNYCSLVLLQLRAIYPKAGISAMYSGCVISFSNLYQLHVIYPKT